MTVYESLTDATGNTPGLRRRYLTKGAPQAVAPPPATTQADGQPGPRRVTGSAVRIRGIALVRVLFGLAWVLDACFKWSPAFRDYFVSYISSMESGQPRVVSDWLHWWVWYLGHNPGGFAYAVAIAESLIAAGLMLGAFTNAVCLGGALLSLGIWSTAEGLGGPYQSGTTDVGTSVIYVLVFPLLAFTGAGGWAGLDQKLRPLLGRWQWLSSRAHLDAPPGPGRTWKLVVAVATAAALAVGFFVAFAAPKMAPMTGGGDTASGSTSPGMNMARMPTASSGANPSQQTAVLNFYANVATSSARTSEVDLDISLLASSTPMFNASSLTGTMLPPSGTGPGIPVHLESTTPGRWVSWGLTVPSPGDWHLRLTVQTPNNGSFTLKPVTIKVTNP